MVQSILGELNYHIIISKKWKNYVSKEKKDLPNVVLIAINCFAKLWIINLNKTTLSHFISCSRNILGWECKNRCWIMHCSTGLGRRVLPPPPSCFYPALSLSWIRIAKQQYMLPQQQWHEIGHKMWHNFYFITCYPYPYHKILRIMFSNVIFIY